jgi:hypothetical protein
LRKKALFSGKAAEKVPQGLKPILFTLHRFCGILSLTGGYQWRVQLLESRLVRESAITLVWVFCRGHFPLLLSIKYWPKPASKVNGSAIFQLG